MPADGLRTDTASKQGAVKHSGARVRHNKSRNSTWGGIGIGRTGMGKDKREGTVKKLYGNPGTCV